MPKIVENIKDPLYYIGRFLKILTKDEKLIPMKLLPMQKHYLVNRTHRDIILKARQMGASTGILAGNTHRVFINPYSKMVLVAHRADVAEYLFQTVHRFWNNLPENMRPSKGWSAGHRIKLDVMDCMIHIDSAESNSIGFSETINYAHLTEFSRWPPGKVDDLYLGITQAVPVKGYITIDSTPKGRGNKFHQLYEAAKRGDNNYTAFFYPWFWEPGYRMPAHDDGSDLEKAAKKLKLSPQNLLDEEDALIRNTSRKHGVDLTLEQIAFRRAKIIEIEELFYQEYPENEIDCWLSSEVSVFDGVAIKRYLQQVEEGRREGNFTIWKDVLGGERYVIGVDPAGGLERGDWSVAAVLRVRTNEYVARLRCKTPPDMFAQECMHLGMRYNNAEMGVEKMMHGHTVLKIMLDSGYPNIYHYQDYDSFTASATFEPGWKTTRKTKPMMVNTLAAALRSGDVQVWSENFLLEASNLMWESEKVKCPPGAHDDEVDALMIALQLRESSPITITQTGQKVESYFTL